VKVTELEAIPFAIPYRKPLRFASGEVTVAEHVLVRVYTDVGLVAPPRRPRVHSHTARPNNPSSQSSTTSSPRR
jgi:hypothetical protein